MTKFIGLDTETVIQKGVHEFYSFQAFSEDFCINNQRISKFSTHAEDLLKFFTAKFNRAWFVTFNLSFDGIVVSRILKDNGYQVSMVLAGSRLIRMTVRRQKLKWILCDLGNVLPLGNLENIGKMLNYPKLEKPSYLGQREPETNEERVYFIRYAMRDAEICFYAAKMVYQEFGTWRTTCAGLAIRVFKRDFVKFPKFHSLHAIIDMKVRESYHGGRTECFIRGRNEKPLQVYDINSLYPYVMKTKQYPNVRKRPFVKHDIDLDKEGIANCRVSVDANFPLLSAKKLLDDGISKLMFPCGKFEGWFTYPELRILEEQNIGKIESCKEAFEYKDVFNPFEKFISHYYAKKQSADASKSPKRNLYKIMLNSTYGKFGEHGETRFLTLDGDEITEEKTSGKREAWYHSSVLASYITAYSRIENWFYLKECKPNELYYTDTDSFHTATDLSRYCTKDLGGLKIESQSKVGDAVFIRSKFYLENDSVVMKGFRVHDNAETIKMSIFKEDFRRQEHRILKVMESRRIGKRPLTDCFVYKNFSVSSDQKRDYLKVLSAKELLFEQSLSRPYSW